MLRRLVRKTGEPRCNGNGEQEQVESPRRETGNRTNHWATHTNSCVLFACRSAVLPPITSLLHNDSVALYGGLLLF